MMKTIRKCMALLLILAAIPFSACTSEHADTLAVKSIDYDGLTELTAAEPDEEMIKNWSLISQNPYVDYICYLTVSGESLVVSNFHDSPNTFMTHRTTNGYFLGVDVGEFDGWVKYFPYYSAVAPEIVGSSRDVVNENCRGFVEDWSRNVYLFTWDYAGLYSPGSGVIYELRLPSLDGEWEWKQVAEVAGKPLFFEYDRENKIIYVVSSMELVAFSLEDYSVTTLSDLSLWGAATSMVRIDNKLYIGMAMGIYEYDLATADTKWYPMDYSKYVS